MKTSERCEPVGVAGIVVVGAAIRVHIADIVGVARIRGALPPVAGRTADSPSPFSVYRFWLLLSFEYLSVRVHHAADQVVYDLALAADIQLLQFELFKLYSILFRYQR